MKPESPRKPTINSIRKRYIRTFKVGDGWTTYLQIDHQSFCVVDDTTRERARWFGKMLAIALERMLNGSQK